MRVAKTDGIDSFACNVKCKRALHLLLRGVELLLRVLGLRHDSVKRAIEIREAMVDPDAEGAMEHEAADPEADDDLDDEFDARRHGERGQHAAERDAALASVAEHADRTYEHFIQIVPTIYKTRRTGEVTVYRYTVSSAEHEDTERYPSAKFTFQVRP